MVKTFFIYVCTLVRRPLVKDCKIRLAYWLRSFPEKKLKQNEGFVLTKPIGSKNIFNVLSELKNPLG